MDGNPYLAWKMFNQEEKENTKGRRKAFDFGTALDILVTQPETSIEEEFHVISVKRPSGKIHDLLIYIESNGLPYSREAIDEAIKAVGFGGANWKQETIEKGIKPLVDYIEALNEAGDKPIITQEQLQLVKKAYSDLKQDPFSNYFLFANSPDYQFEIVVELEGVLCKGLLDVVHIDRSRKTFTIVDLKSMEGNPLFFWYNFFKFRYDIQAAFYKRLMEEKFPGYTFEGFYFVVASSTNEGAPIVYRVTDKILQMGEKGGMYRGIWFKGYEALLEEFIIRVETNNFILPLDYQQGYTYLDDSQIIV
jgi:hypothetical protein